MRYKLTADLVGDVFIRSENGALAASHADLDFALESDSSGRVARVSVSAKVPQNRVERLRSTISREGENHSHITVGADTELHERLLGQLQLLEAQIGYGFVGAPLERIRWDVAETKVIPESPEEEALLQVWDVKVNRSYPKTRGVFTKDSFAEMVTSMGDYASLLEAKTLWREGMAAQKRQRYVQAFQNFFFALEDLYADGKTSEKEVVRRFQESGHVMDACARFLSWVQHEKRHRGLLERYFGDTRCNIADRSEMARMLFRMRGALLHFSRKRKHGAAAVKDQRGYETLALLSGYVANMCIGRQIID